MTKEQLKSATETINKIKEMSEDITNILQYDMVWSEEGDALDDVSTNLYVALSDIQEKIGEAVNEAEYAIKDIAVED